MSETRRYLGLELSGAKNQKTSFAVLEFYPKEKKIFLLDIFERIVAAEDQTGDEALLAVIEEFREGAIKMGVNVPLSLPPCIQCDRKTCPLPMTCSVPEVKWMREFSRKHLRSPTQPGRAREFTPYTQRPIELWIRGKVFPELDDPYHFDIDETLGANRAPLTVRMNFLQRHLGDLPLVEVWPKLTIAVLGSRLGLHKRTITMYRHLENGAHFREEILQSISKQHQVFIYERDMRKLSQNLNAFDAFICALTAWLSDIDLCVKPGKTFHSNWVEHPL